MCLYLKVAWKLRIIYLIFLVILLLAWHLRIHYSRLTYYRGLLTINKGLKRRMNDLGSNNVQIEGKTQQSDIFITVKTTGTHANKLNLLFATWIKQAKDETYVITDRNHNVPYDFPADHILVTNCSKGYTRRGLCCKMGREYNEFMKTAKRWFCHVDDDTYINIPALVRLLQNYTYTDKWYLGKLTYTKPFTTLDRNRRSITFRFAHGGAGFCISRVLAEEMIPFARGNRMEKLCDFIQQLDDPTIGYIIHYILKIPLTVVNLFHSHHEPLHTISTERLSEQVTFSYKLTKTKNNVVNITGYNLQKDPSRWLY